MKRVDQHPHALPVRRDCIADYPSTFIRPTAGKPHSDDCLHRYYEDSGIAANHLALWLHQFRVRKGCFDDSILWVKNKLT